MNKTIEELFGTPSKWGRSTYRQASPPRRRRATPPRRRTPPPSPRTLNSFNNAPKTRNTFNKYALAWFGKNYRNQKLSRMMARDFHPNKNPNKRNKATALTQLFTQLSR
jgi:hypothetical protein